jgi:ssDNA-binding Zn-finger/Zn-ribbon topoisomerase 1
VTGPSDESPFSLLADETRLGVIETIGRRSGDGEYACLPYSTVREALGEVDSGRLNYHLRKLRGRFVERTDDGYQLTVAGIRVYQAVASGSFDGVRTTVPPTETDVDCEHCGSPVLVSYEDGRFFVRCPDCDVVYQRYPLPPTAFDPEDPEDLLRVGLTKAHHDGRSMVSGLCPYCSGRVERSVSGEDRGATDDDDRWELYAHLSCPSCGWFLHPPVEMVLVYHPLGSVFYERRGVADLFERLSIPGEWESRVRSTDPLLVDVEMTCDGESLHAVLDDGLDLVEWTLP